MAITRQKGTKPKGVSRRQPSALSESVAFDTSSLRRLLVRLFLLGLLAVVALTGFRALAWFQQVEIESIEFYGYSGNRESNRGVSLLELEENIRDYTRAPYWKIDLRELQQHIESHPWIRSAVVTREWPNHLRVGVDEQVVIARWNREHLLTATGDLIHDSNAVLLSSLPQFVIPDSRQLSSTEISFLVEQYNSMQRLLLLQQQKVVEMGVSVARGTWIRLESGTQIELGKQQHATRLSRLIALVESGTVSGWTQMAIADLRYQHGVSIRWSEAEFEEELEALEPLARLHSMQTVFAVNGDVHG